LARPATRPSTVSRKRRAPPGSLEDLRRELWHAVLTASELLDGDDEATRLKAVHAMTQAAGQYRALYETMELQERVAALEQRLGAAA